MYGPRCILHSHSFNISNWLLVYEKVSLQMDVSGINGVLEQRGRRVDSTGLWRHGVVGCGL